jgi:hypothetical protein
MQITFSNAIKTLLFHGFELALEEVWGGTGDDQPYHIYINPEHFVIATISGTANDLVKIFQMYFTWVPLSDESLAKIINSTEDPFVKYAEDVVNRKKANIRLKDPLIKEFGFPMISSSSFLSYWEFYSLILENANCIPWPILTPNITFIKPEEKDSFSYQFVIDSDKFYTADEIRENIEREIENMRSNKIRRISFQRLQQALSNLDLLTENFGLPPSQ